MEAFSVSYIVWVHYCASGLREKLECFLMLLPVIYKFYIRVAYN